MKTFLVLLKRKRHRRNVVTLFLLNLTLVSALMVCQMPFNIHAAMKQKWIFGDGFCQFNGFSNVFLCMDQIFTLLCLTIDRYLAVVKPLRHRSLMTRRTAYKMLAGVYFLSFLLAVVPIFGQARNKRVLISKSSTSTLSSKDAPSFDSNSLGNFEDASTDPSSETEYRLAALKIIEDSKRGIAEYDNKEKISDCKITEDFKNEIGKSDLDTSVESDHLPVECTTRTHSEMTKSSKEAFVGNSLNCGSTSKQQFTENGSSKKNKTGNARVEQDLPTNSSNELRLTREESGKNHKSYSVDTRNGDRASLKNKSTSNIDDASQTRIRYINVTGEENFEIEKDVPHSDSKTEGLTEKATCSARDTCTDDDSSAFGMDESHKTAGNKHVSFDSALEASPSKEKDGKRRRLSGLFQVPRSCKAITDLVIARMKKQKAIRHEFKIARTGTILVLSFLILWMPYVIAHSCFVGACRTMTFYNIAMFLVYTNALANPIIYALTNKTVMQDIRKSMEKFCG
ncbi:uncharacterized protein LOC114517649 [Dendronephthya gigantea]|uniref:uncharacterized protein LOC114517649 n=1 Tax=Dendronephthya gigantea TaxID=151771 RepID=UPI00106A9842|nr:uncharacterized protein LOC114517649 [Dendronephthya gigantea]